MRPQPESNRRLPALRQVLYQLSYVVDIGIRREKWTGDKIDVTTGFEPATLALFRNSALPLSYGVMSAFASMNWSGHPDSNRSLTALQAAALIAWLCPPKLAPNSEFRVSSCGVTSSTRNSKPGTRDSMFGMRGRTRTFINSFLRRVPRPVWATRT